MEHDRCIKGMLGERSCLLHQSAVPGLRCAARAYTGSVAYCHKGFSFVSHVHSGWAAARWPGGRGKGKLVKNTMTCKDFAPDDMFVPLISLVVASDGSGRERHHCSDQDVIYHLPLKLYHVSWGFPAGTQKSPFELVLWWEKGWEAWKQSQETSEELC